MQLDEQIREALALEARAIPAEAIERLRRIDYHPRRHALAPPLAAGALVAAGATAGTLLALGGAGSQEAFAGWSARPTRAPVGQASVVEAKCAARMAEVSRMPRPSKNGVSISISPEPLLADTRGPYTLVLYPQVLCFSGPDFVSLRGNMVAAGVSIGTAYRDGGPYTIAQGPAALDASAVTLALDHGSSVQATVGHSSFVAWWPGASRPTSVTITSPSGTRTEPLSYPRTSTPPGTKPARGQTSRSEHAR
jgi:hypothetical protein